MTRRINAAGVEIITKDEQGPGGGPALVAYRCPAGIWTLGWGHTAGVKEGDRCSWAQAAALLEGDLAWAEAEVAARVTVPLGDNQFAALVSFTFNCGRYAFDHSTLLSDIDAGYFADVPVQLARWTHAKGVELPGLARRRQQEITLWLAPDGITAPIAPPVSPTKAPA